MNRWIGQLLDRQTNRWIDWQTDGQTHEQVDRLAHGQAGIRDTDMEMHRRTNGQADGQKDIDICAITLSISYCFLMLKLYNKFLAKYILFKITTIDIIAIH